MGIKYKNTWLGAYYPLPIVRMRFQTNDTRIIWAIPKEIPEYHNIKTVPKPHYKMSVNISGILDDKEVLTIDRSLWTVYYFEGRKTFLYPGWGYLNMSLDSNLRRLDINQGINRMLAYEVTSYKPIYMDNRENYANEDRGRCMPPYPLYWAVARLQYTNLHAGYRQWTTQDWKHFGGKVFQGWKIVGKKAKETIETIVKMGQNIIGNTFGAIQWIIDNWYVILIVGAFIGILILLELTGLGGLLRGLLKGLCCTTVNGIMQVAGTDKEDKQVLIEKKMHRKTLTEHSTPLVRGVTQV